MVKKNKNREDKSPCGLFSGGWGMEFNELLESEKDLQSDLHERKTCQGIRT